MKTRKLRAKAAAAVAAGLMSVMGCNTPQLSEPPPATKKSAAKLPRRPAVKPKPTAKPSNAADDFKERHPSQWKKKLKAAYA